MRPYLVGGGVGIGGKLNQRVTFSTQTRTLHRNIFAPIGPSDPGMKKCQFRATSSCASTHCASCVHRVYWDGPNNSRSHLGVRFSHSRAYYKPQIIHQDRNRIQICRFHVESKLIPQHIYPPVHYQPSGISAILSSQFRTMKAKRWFAQPPHKESLSC